MSNKKPPSYLNISTLQPFGLYSFECKECHTSHTWTKPVVADTTLVLSLLILFDNFP